MNYLARYQQGEYEQVWNELKALGPAVRQEPYYAQAQEVAAETMRRVRRNCEHLVSRLGGLGYDFGTFPDGSPHDYSTAPLAPPSEGVLADCARSWRSSGRPWPLRVVTPGYEYPCTNRNVSSKADQSPNPSLPDPFPSLRRPNSTTSPKIPWRPRTWLTNTRTLPIDSFAILRIGSPRLNGKGRRLKTNGEEIEPSL